MSQSNRNTLRVAGALEFLRLPEVCMRTGLSRSAIYRNAATESFPRPVKLGERASAWVAAEIEQWIQSRIEARDFRPCSRGSHSAPNEEPPK
jgi:prophage regulatory protein